MIQWGLEGDFRFNGSSRTAQLGRVEVWNQQGGRPLHLAKQVYLGDFGC